MPIYEYQCKKCGDFEVMQKMSDAPLSECPTCHRKVRKLISSTSFQLKGSGWYITDYGKKGGGAGKSDDKKPADKKAAESSSESKETKSDSASSSTDSGSTATKSGEKAAAA